MKDLFLITIAIYQLKELRSGVMVDSPDHLEEGPGHRYHWATFRAIRAWLKEAFDLSFEGPPVMDIKGMVYEDDCVCCFKTLSNQVKRSPAIDNPALIF